MSDYVTPEDLARIIKEYGQAMRGDWGIIDGRSVRDQLDDFAEQILNPSTTPALLRSSMGICPKGEGHWNWPYCADYGCEDSVVVASPETGEDEQP